MGRKSHSKLVITAVICALSVVAICVITEEGAVQQMLDSGFFPRGTDASMIEVDGE